jgi:hypothetical protein
MPIVRTAGKLIYFAHVPKCGGTSVERYLARRFGPLAFLDRKHLDWPTETKWTASSPQHVPSQALERLFPVAFFDAIFAVVRHPISRIVSAYSHDVERRTSKPRPDFSSWLAEALEAERKAPGTRDNHLRPQHAFFPKARTKVFRLEDGLDAIVPWLDTITTSTSEPRKIGHVNRGTVSAQLRAASLVRPADMAAIVAYYADDFKEFGYSASLPETPSNHAPQKPGIWRRIMERRP